MENTLAKKFTFPSLLAFALPNVMMMITLSMYIIIDGMFISKILGTTALSAANMIYPVISLEMALAIMIATGGSAIVAKLLGEKKQKEAQKKLSFLIVVELILGIIIAFIGTIFVDKIVVLLGANATQTPLCITYAKILFIFAPAFFLQTAFQTFLVTAGKPTLGLVVTLFAGITNIILDYLFMAIFHMGIMGAALATGIGYCIPALVGLCYFIFSEKNYLHFVKPQIDWKLLRHACTNGSSEMVTNLANAVTTFLFNYIFLKYYGENGVAAITIILYFQYIFTALHFGYAGGIAPIISYKYGQKNNKQLQSIFKKSMLFLIISSVVSTIIIHITITKTLTIFTPVGSKVYNIALYGFPLYSVAFVLMGLGIFASAMFTAFSDGKTSAIISFSRTFIFIIVGIFLWPQLFGEVGLWLAVPIAEVLTVVITLYYLQKKRHYGYLPQKIVSS